VGGRVGVVGGWRGLWRGWFVCVAGVGVCHCVARVLQSKKPCKPKFTGLSGLPRCMRVA